MKNGWDWIQAQIVLMFLIGVVIILTIGFFIFFNYKTFIMTNTNLYTICFLVALVSIFFFLNPFLWAQGLAIGLGVFAAAISVVAFIKAQK